MAKRSDDYIIRLKANNADLKKKVAESRRELSRYKSQVSGIGRGLSSTMATLFAAGSITAFGIAQVELIKKIDNLNRSLKAVTETSEEYQQSQKFLSETAHLYGVNINTLTGQYVKYLTAVRDTKLEGEAGAEVFRKLTKAGAVLSLSNEQLEGTFRAVEQMLSKGTIQAEEIRGQLSERLPGAYEILAKSMGITTQELGKQLKDGKVMAEDVLPKFADQLLKTYGADKVSKIESVTAAQTRTRNEWTQLIAEIDSGDGVISRVLKNFHTGLSTIIKDMRTAMSGNADFMEGFEHYGKMEVDASNAVFRVQQLIKFQKELARINDKINSQDAPAVMNFGSPMAQQNDPTEGLRERADFVRGAIEALQQSLKGYRDGLEKTKQSNQEAVMTFKMIQAAITPSKTPNAKGTSLIDTGLQESTVSSLASFRENMREQYLQINADQQAFSNERIRMWQDEIMAMNSLLDDTLANSVGGFFENIAIKANGNVTGVEKAFQGMLLPIADGLSRFGNLLLAQGFAIAAFKKSLSSLNAPLAIAAGVALKVAAGTVRHHASRLARGPSGAGGDSGGESSDTGRVIRSADLQGQKTVNIPDVIYLKAEGEELQAAIRTNEKRRGRTG